MIRFSFFTAFFFSVLFGLSAQFSVDGGLTLPVGSFADEDDGSAGLGFRIGLNYDWALNEQLGISSRLFFGANGFKEDEPDLEAGAWGVGGIGAGLYFQPQDALKFYGLLLVGYGSTPELNIANTVGITEASAAALGIELGAKYFFSNAYIMASFTTFTPEFEFDFGGLRLEEEQNIGFLSIGAGYQFGQ